MQWFRYIIGKKYRPNVQMCYQLYVTFFFRQFFYVSLIFYNFYKFKKPAFVTVQVFQVSDFWIRSYANWIDKQYCIKKKWKFGFGWLIRILDYYWRKKRLRIRDLLRNFSIFWPIILFTDSLPVYHRCDISNCRELSFNPLDEFPSFLPHTNSCYCICSLKKMCNFW